MKTEFLGFRFDPISMPEALAWIDRHMAGERFRYVVTPNVDHVVQLDKTTDCKIRAAYSKADLTLCDSRILGLLARRSGLDLPPITGSDLTREWLNQSTQGRRLAIIGGDEAMLRSLERLYPIHDWVQHIPPMGVLRNPCARRDIIDFVAMADADMVFLAIGAPQSELCCREIAESGNGRGVALCIGASLEFIVGKKQRAPSWMQKSALEWLYRLLREPRRLWRRYLVDGPRIFRLWRAWENQS